MLISLKNSSAVLVTASQQDVCHNAVNIYFIATIFTLAYSGKK